MIAKIFTSSFRYKGFYAFSNMAPIEQGVYDVSNILSAIQPPSSIQTADMMTKLSLITPTHLYNSLDVFSRDLLFYLADDMNWGIGLGILGISVAIKVVFAPLMLAAQLNGIKLKLIEPETKNFQNLSQRLMRAQDMNGAKAARKQFALLKRKHGISMALPMLSMLQMPVLITWFLSLRYILYLPDKFEGIRSQGFLWFQDLSDYDPYGILPIMSALFTYWNISLNPNMSSNSSIPFAKYARYMRFLPFFSIPIVIFFPAGLNLYWCTSAFFHLLITATSRSKYIRKICGIPEYLPGTILERQHLQKTTTILKAQIEGEKIQKEVIDHVAKELEKQAKIEAVQPKVKIFAQKPKKKTQ